MIYFGLVSFRFYFILFRFCCVSFRFVSFLFRFLFYNHPQYLGFTWFFEGKIRYFVFAVLPSGISTAGYIFSKVLREFVKDFRSKGKRITMVLDDGLAGDNDYDTAVKSSREEMTNCKIFVF